MVLGQSVESSRGQRRFNAAGRRKRRQILDAAVEVFSASGPGAFTHRAVAEAAGVPVGLMTYYFADGEALMRETMDHAVQLESARMRRLLGEVSTPLGVSEAVDVLADMFLDKTVANPLHDLALFEMFMEATRDDDVRTVTVAWTQMIAGLIDDVLPPSVPSLSRADAIQIVAAAIDGLMLEEMSNKSLGLKKMRDLLGHVVRSVSDAL